MAKAGAKPITISEYLEWVGMVGQGLSRKAAAAALGRPLDSIRNPRVRRNMKAQGVDLAAVERALKRLPAETKPTYEPLTLPLDNALVWGDFHMPHYNRDMVRRAFTIVNKHFPQVDTAIFGGDTFDFASISQHPHTETEPDLEDNLEATKLLLMACGEVFKRQVFCNGNHDKRVAKKLDAGLTLERLIYAALAGDRCASEIIVTELDYLLLGDSWLIGHPSAYSGQGGKTPSDLADKYQRNVITFHNHVAGMSPSKSGQYWGIDAGHMTVQARHNYASMALTKHVNWKGGFVIISDKTAFTFYEGATDWTWWGTF